MHYGCAWYPEHWTPKEWECDLGLMREAGLTVVRICEFAWSRMEPADGVFDFSWVDAAIDAAQRHGLAVVLGTPSAAPPAWMTAAYPTAARLSRKKAIIVSAALLAFFIVGLTPPGPPDLLIVEISSKTTEIIPVC